MKTIFTSCGSFEKRFNKKACNECHVQCKTAKQDLNKYLLNKSVSTINDPADIMFVGLSAKFDKEQLVMKPLCSSTNTGKIIDKIEERLSENIIVYRTNLVKCPPVDKNNKIRYPNKKEMTHCLEHLYMEIYRFNPKIIIMLGEQVSNFIIETLELSHNAFKYVFSKTYIKDDLKFIATHHPSYIYIYKRKILNEYIQEIVDLINNKLSLAY